MARLTTTITIDAQLHERLTAVKEATSVAIRHQPHSLGLLPMLGLLIDHWQQHPPDPEWLEQQQQLYPKRGRPRKSEKLDASDFEAHDRKARLRKDKGHELIGRRREEGAPYRTWFCKHCTMQWSTWDFPSPPAGCPAGGKFSSLYSPKIWTKSELLAAGFEEDEVAWLAPTP